MSMGLLARAHTVRRRTPLMPYEQALRDSAIEPGVAPLVQALHDVGCRTIASCHGHGRARWWIWSQRMIQHPFVLFDCSLGMARRIDALIGCGHGPGNTKMLHYCWRLVAWFGRGSCELVWSIEPNDSRLPGQYDGARLHADLAVLAAMVRKHC